MFAPKPLDVAREWSGVTRPGEELSWELDTGDPYPGAQILKIRSAYTPPPEGFVSPMLWE